MKKLVQIKGKAVLTQEPVPRPQQGFILVRNLFSAISPGTETERLRLAANLIQAAQNRPDQVRAVLNLARARGVAAAFKLVKQRLDQPVPLGYSCAGVVEETGPLVSQFNPGQLVACAGVGFADHAEFVSVPVNMAVQVPQGVKAQHASLATLGAIAFWAVKRARVSAGERVLVVGLGVVGNLVAQIARWHGAEVDGLDLNGFRREVASKLDINALDPAAQDQDAYDAVIVATSDPKGEIAALAGRAAGPGARVVFMSRWQSSIPYNDFYLKQLEILSSRAYGPGRYDPMYEIGGVDYPVDVSRWSVGRNMAAFLKGVALGSIKLEPLITHIFPIEDGPKAYDTALEGRDFVAILISYPESSSGQRVLRISKPRRSSDKPGVALVGAGNFATSTLIPGIKKWARPLWVISPNNPGSVAQRYGFANASTQLEAGLEDPDVEAVFIATPHALHGQQVLAALRAGKAVFCEKPLAVEAEELRAIEEQLAEQPGFLFVDFNRRFSAFAARVFNHVKNAGVLQINIRVNAGSLPQNHWLRLPEHGGRAVGEACHFIDLARFLARSRIIDVNVVGQGPDSALIQLIFSNGSGASISYLSDGPGSLAKERIEVIGRSRAAVIDDFTKLWLYGPSSVSRTSSNQDKGHTNALRAFFQGLDRAEPPIPFEELFEVSWANLALRGEKHVYGNNTGHGPDS